MAQAEKRQVVSAYATLPPFEVVDYPKSIAVKVKTQGGDIFDINVPIQIFPDQHAYEKEFKEQIISIENGTNLARADKVELINKGDTNE